MRNEYVYGRYAACKTAVDGINETRMAPLVTI